MPLKKIPSFLRLFVYLFDFYQHSVFHLKFSIQLSDCVCPNLKTIKLVFIERVPKLVSSFSLFLFYFYFIPSFVYSFILLFVHSFLHFFVHSFICSFVYSFFHSDVILMVGYLHLCLIPRFSSILHLIHQFPHT